MNARSVLIAAGRGVGDIVRVTPLVRACALLGYDVDVLLAPDYADAASLVRGAPEIRRLHLLPSPWNPSGTSDIAGLDTRAYDVAVYTVWTTEHRSLVCATREVAFDRSTWFTHGDSACVEAAARALGWAGPLPPPFVMASARRFELPPGTVALHPGCKPDWPWKKWHGFDELAARLPHVAIVGTPSDVDNRGTYFNRDFAWPPHARSFIGALDLPDTVALLSECAALVSNDSGLMHVGVALRLPTYGIFGITNPAREAIPAANMIAIEKGLPCEAACRRGAWGRRDCEHHLECLRTLSCGDVLAVMAARGTPCATH